VQGVAYPDYPAMPDRNDLLPMPGKGWLHKEPETKAG
jgi:hypothetical protein